jgi:NADH-quinone oxidoreductase subunit G
MVLGRDKVTPEIVYFGDRCVLCTRCVRFMTEIAQEPVLQVIQRGHRGYIDTMTDELFEHPFSMNIVDVCPVGALVNEDFLFKARAWDLDKTPSVCPGCSQGCNITLGTKENRVLRAKPRPNPEVNSFWMCDHGRKIVANWGAGDRIEAPLLRDGDRLTAVDWGRALDALVDLIQREPGGARAVVSPGSSNENLFVLRRLMDRFGFEGGGYRTQLGDEHVLKGFPKLALRSERAPNVRGAESFGFRREDDVYRAVGGHDGVIFVLDEVLDDAPESFGDGAAAIIYVGTRMNAGARKANLVLPSTEFTEMEGTFTNYEGRVQRFTQAVRPAGLARPFWMTGSAALARVGVQEAYRSAGAAFAALAGEYDDFSGLSYERIGLHGAVGGRSSATAVS